MRARAVTTRAMPRRRGRGRAILLVAAALVATAVTLLMFAEPTRAQPPASRPATRVAAHAPAAARRGPNTATARGRRAPDSSSVVIEREVFAYAPAGRRDPFRSLLTTSELRPLLGELRVVAVAVDPTGHNSVAILRDLTTKAQHRVRVGQLLGRMRVAQIRARAVVFTIEELGYSRQETLALSDSTVARNK